MCLEYGVVMVRHQAEREALGIETLQGLTEEFKSPTLVLSVVKNGLVPVSPCSYVIQRAGKFSSQRTGHSKRLGPDRAKGKT